MKAKQLPSGNYRVRVDAGMKDGKRIVKSFTAATRKEAEYLALQYSIDKKEAVTETIKGAIDVYITNRTAVLSPSTIRGYRLLQRTAYNTIEHLKICDFDNVTLQRWVNQYASGRSPKSVRNAYGLLVAAIKSVAPSQTLQARLPQNKVIERHIPVDDDIRELLAHANRNVRIAIMLAAVGTLRRGEICSLTYEDITGTTIHVHTDMVRDEHGNWIVKDIPKTSSSDRYIDMPEEVIDAIGAGEGRIVAITPRTLSNQYQALRDKLGMPYRFHDLRHYAASIMHAIGVPDVYIMERGGWRSDTVLKSVYRNVLSDKRNEFAVQTNEYAKRLF